MTGNRHIMLISSYLHVPGGYERAVVETATLLHQQGWQVTLLLLAGQPESFYPLPEGISILQAELNFGISPEGNMFSRKARFLKDLLELRKLVARVQPAHIICSEYHFAVAAVLAGTGKKAKVYSWEHHHYATQHRNLFWKTLFYYAYRRLDAIICLNPDEQAWYSRINKKAIVIPNFTAVPAGSGMAAPSYELISISRFNAIKGIDLLVDTARIVFSRRPGTRWLVIGYGEKESWLRDQIEKEGWQNTLLLHTADKPDVADYYRQARLFVMTSRNECFPLVLLEAMRCGLPCLAFDCDTGPRHIIRDHINGRLAEKENPVSLAETILYVLDNTEESVRLAAGALETAGSYTPEIIYKKWEALLLQ